LIERRTTMDGYEASKPSVLEQGAVIDNVEGGVQVQVQVKVKV